jgi:mono/diheme cytochrome c family protein
MGPELRGLRSCITVAEAATEAATVCDAPSTAPKARRPIRSGLGAIFATVLSSMLIICFAPSADAQQSSTPDRVAAGRGFALSACSGCHVVAADQPFAPVITGPPPPPDFRSIANKPNTTAESLRKFLSTRPSVPPLPPPQHMANADLTSDQLEDVVAFIMTLRAGH